MSDTHMFVEKHHDAQNHNRVGRCHPRGRGGSVDDSGCPDGRRWRLPWRGLSRRGGGGRLRGGGGRGVPRGGGGRGGPPRGGGRGRPRGGGWRGRSPRGGRG